MTLDLQDLGPQVGGEAGVRVWRERRPDAKGSRPTAFAWVLAWHDLVLFDVRLVRSSWPEGCRPDQEDGWGEAPTRVVWSPVLARFIYSPRTTAPAISAALVLRPGDGARTTFIGQRVRGLGYPARSLTVAGSSPVYWSEETQGRIERALGTSIDRLDLRRVRPSWAPGSSIVVVWYSGRIRGICSVREEHGG